MSAVMSDCLTWRYRLEREIDDRGPVFAYFGVNGSTATADENDHTVNKWIGFTRINGGRKFIVGNPFAYRATDVRELSRAADPVGPDNAMHLTQIIADADVLIPCWGNQSKVPKHLRTHIRALKRQIFAAGKPVRIFGLTKSGDPLHPLMLGYSTPLTMWSTP